MPQFHCPFGPKMEHGMMIALRTLMTEMIFDTIEIAMMSTQTPGVLLPRNRLRCRLFYVYSLEFKIELRDANRSGESRFQEIEASNWIGGSTINHFVPINTRCLLILRATNSRANTRAWTFALPPSTSKMSPA